MPDIDRRCRRHLSCAVDGFLYGVIWRVETMLITGSHDENASGVGAQGRDE